MIVAEFFFPTYGSLGIGGLVAFVVGSLILFDSDIPGLRVGRPLIAAFATVGALTIAGIVYLAGRSLRRPVVTGTRGMIGAERRGGGRLHRPRPGALRRGAVERRTAPCRCSAGQQARIVKVEGLTLWVEPQ